MPDGGPGEPAVIVDAATVVVVRASAQRDGIEVLMLHKHAAHAFGGSWVFPGGRVDPGDGGATGVERARSAAVREAAEEAGIVVAPEDLVPFAHWTPPPEAPRRFATWFFVTEARDILEVVVDGSEIVDHLWVSPAEALDRHGRGEIELATPTWMTLHRLRDAQTPGEVVDAATREDPATYATQIALHDGMLVAMWAGDAGYGANDPTLSGPRHRLMMPRGEPWTFEQSDE